MTYDGKSRLGDLFESRRERGRTGLPLLSVTMNDGLVDREDLERKQDTALAADEHLLVRPGDIAYNMMRMWQGAFGLADREGLVSPAYVVLKPKEGIVPAYAAQLFRTPRMLYLMWAYSHGLTDDRLRLYFPDFASIKVTVPTKEVQRRVAQVLETWDRAIDLKRQLAVNALRQRQALLHRLMDGDGETRQVRADRTIARLGDLVGALEAGVSVNGLDRAAAQGEAGVLKISAVTSGAFDPSANKAIRPEEVAQARVSPRADRILVSRCNTAELLGASAYVDADYPSLFLPDKLWQLAPKSSTVVHMRWLAYWLAARTTRIKISSFATGSSGSMKNIAKDQLLALAIAVPPYEEQVRIAHALSDWDQAAENFGRQAEMLVVEKRALAARFLRGNRSTPHLVARVVP